MSEQTSMKQGEIKIGFGIKTNHSDMSVQDWESFRKELHAQLDALITEIIDNPPAEQPAPSSVNDELLGGEWESAPEPNQS